MSLPAAPAEIVVLGVFAADLVFRVDRLPVMGETIAGRGFAIGPGGKGSNQAVAAARAGGKVALLTRIGADSFGELGRSVWREAGIDDRAVTVDPTAVTGTAAILIANDTGANAIVIEGGAAAAMTEGDIQAADTVISGGSVFVAQLEQPLALVMAGLRAARRHGVTTILNPAPARDLPSDIYPLCDYLIPNETEAQALTGIAVDTDDGAEKAARALIDRGVSTVVITLGERGALLADRTGMHRYPVLPDCLVIDTSGAGDAFTGGFAAALAEGLSAAAAVRFATAAAGLSVTRHGTAASMPLRGEIDAVLPLLTADPENSENN